MIKNSAGKITSYLISNNEIKNEEYDIYLYAFETIIAFIINIAVILFVGFIFDRFTETLLFLLFYCPIRQFSGGYHADNYRKCLLAFIILYLTNMYIIEKLLSFKSNSIVIILMTISYIGILSPQEHRNNPLIKSEVKKYKKIVIYLSSFLFVTSTIGINFTITKEYATYTASVIVCIFIMLILGIIKKREELCHEEKF
ncbi:accessory gene regulator ArgB-like protein [Metaclostridioides mangenotii]|uniref:accessory gene regulator ArgB-like protein n=1 Tax=Metaclostridioides mangenotii TaxID=1540 RepID=UPI000481BA29|nr:accessory gene regulator B family protein [Clostridioides mangenotii]